jgi:hypothetical protein
MKTKGWKKAVALAVCACACAGSAATAQVTIGWSSSNAVQNTLGTSSGYASGASRSSVAPAPAMPMAVGGAFVINRFGARDGRIVAYGRLVPVMGVELDAGATTGSSVSRSGMLLSSPAEPAGGYGADPRLGMGSKIAYSDVIVGSPALGASVGVSSSTTRGTSLGGANASAGSIGSSPTWGINTSFDASRLGDWTGIGTGYGESGVESRSTMTRDIEEETAAFNLGRPYDDQSYMEDITWDGHATMNDDLALRADRALREELAWSTDQEMLGDLEMSVVDDRPLVQLGGSAGLYSRAEAERVLMLGSSSDIAIPVSVVAASCDAVSLSFAGVETVTVRSTSDEGRLGSTLCALSEAAALSPDEGQQAKLLKHLNRLISDVD